MNKKAEDLCDIVVVVNQRGLHARAAAKFARVAEKYQAEVTVIRDEMRVSGRSIMGLMMLAATSGTRLKIYAVGPQAAMVLAELGELVKRGFDEE